VIFSQLDARQIHCLVSFSQHYDGMTPDQCRAARALLGWAQPDLAARSGVSGNTISSFEKGATSPIPANLAALVAAFTAAGVDLIPENGGGEGVRRRKPAGKPAKG
jgi:transcriptional regulator with XRE-family HTH domain